MYFVSLPMHTIPVIRRIAWEYLQLMRWYVEPLRMLSNDPLGSASALQQVQGKLIIRA